MAKRTRDGLTSEVPLWVKSMDCTRVTRRVIRLGALGLADQGLGLFSVAPAAARGPAPRDYLTAHGTWPHTCVPHLCPPAGRLRPLGAGGAEARGNDRHPVEPATENRRCGVTSSSPLPTGPGDGRDTAPRMLGAAGPARRSGRALRGPRDTAPSPRSPASRPPACPSACSHRGVPGRDSPRLPLPCHFPM